MKKYLLLITYHLSLIAFCYAQNPLVKQWDYRFGGMDDDELFSFQKIADGGYILGGSSVSGISGDKTQNTWAGSYDYWVVKTDSLGNKQWDKDFGGTGLDWLYALQQTTDGGYILGGFSLSDSSGDKTQDTWGSFDYWVVKIDSLGNKQWDKDFGGTNDDELYSLQQTNDGGFLLGGYSNSGISGDKTQNAWGGSYDYWIVKIDSQGNKQWDKDFGGIYDDLLYSLQQTADGGYLLGGYSMSGISGDKTQNTWGSTDYWVIKIDSAGNKQWDKDFGGAGSDKLFSLQQTADVGTILGGYSNSHISGDKTQDTWGGFDYWIVKIDSGGNKQWDKDFGGSINEDEFGNVFQTSDGGYLASGTSYSLAGGDKTENNLGQEQTWIVKTDSLGNKQWDKTLFTTGHDEQGLTVQLNDGCFVIANVTNGEIAGDKSQPSWGATYDYWIIKLCDTTSTTSVPILNHNSSTINIYPNPANEFVVVSYASPSASLWRPKESGDKEIIITDVLGKEMYRSSLTTHNTQHTTQIDIRQFPSGIYFIKAGNKAGKFVKQ